MNNTVLRIISAILALGAVVVGYLAIHLSRSTSAPTPAATQPAEPSQPVVAVATATKGVKAGEMLIATDVAVKGVRGAPSNAYTQMQDVVGRVAVSDIPAGAVLMPNLFAADSISYLLKPGERAIGVPVDEISAVGGFIKPGDMVDVLAFMSKDTDGQTNAQVVVDNVRLLTVGDSTQFDAQRLDGPGTNSPKDAGNLSVASMSGTGSAGMKEKRIGLRSVVLAVRESELNRLMLAANAGILRLALRPPVGADPNANLGQGKGVGRQRPPAAVLSDLAQGRKAGTGTGTGTRYVIQEGSKEREVLNEVRAAR
jgi:pilus assembly protein CpaB